MAHTQSRLVEQAGCDVPWDHLASDIVAAPWVSLGHTRLHSQAKLVRTGFPDLRLVQRYAVDAIFPLKEAPCPCIPLLGQGPDAPASALSVDPVLPSRRHLREYHLAPSCLFRSPNSALRVESPRSLSHPRCCGFC